MYARDCAAPPSPHYTDGDGNYVVIPDAIVAKVRAAGVAAGRLFASEFPGEVLDPAATDWDAVAWQSDLADGLLGEYGEWLADELWATYSAALVEETIRLA